MYKYSFITQKKTLTQVIWIHAVEPVYYGIDDVDTSDSEDDIAELVLQ